MKKKYIVKEKREFDRIIKKSQCKKNKYFVIYYDKNEESYDKYGISVGKKIGNAVERNKYKRRIRMIINEYKKDYNNSQNYIIILRGSAKDIHYQELQESFFFLMNIIRKDIVNNEK